MKTTSEFSDLRCQKRSKHTYFVFNDESKEAKVLHLQARQQKLYNLLLFRCKQMGSWPSITKYLHPRRGLNQRKYHHFHIKNKAIEHYLDIPTIWINRNHSDEGPRIIEEPKSLNLTFMLFGAVCSSSILSHQIPIPQFPF